MTERTKQQAEKDNRQTKKRTTDKNNEQQKEREMVKE